VKPPEPRTVPEAEFFRFAAPVYAAAQGHPKPLRQLIKESRAQRKGRRGRPPSSHAKALAEEARQYQRFCKAKDGARITQEQAAEYVCKEDALYWAVHEGFKVSRSAGLLLGKDKLSDALSKTGDVPLLPDWETRAADLLPTVLNELHGRGVMRKKRRRRPGGGA
jgi:hypothetical protein